MRHRVAGRKLGRTTEHRVAMLRNMTTSLFDKEKIRTTLIKAKELRPFAERLITISKKDSLHARRRVLQQIRDKSVVAKLFDTLAPRYSERPGGYTRIIKLGPRRGDNAEMALVELVDSAPAPVERDEPKTKKATKRTTSRKAASGDDASAGAEKKAGAKKAAKKKTTKAASKKSAGKKTAAKKAAKKKTTKKSAAE